MQTPDQKLSYIIGYNTAQNYANDPVLELDQDLLIQGLKDAFARKKPAVDQAAAQAASAEVRQRHEAAQAELGRAVKAQGEAFLKENKGKQGIVTTPSGLQYEVLTKGESTESPCATDKVKVHYHGTLTNGNVFDSSVQRGEPISFPLNGVISGWTEGLQLMSIGDKFRFYIPSELAYGSRGQGSIPPHSVLVFDVELLGIN